MEQATPSTSGQSHITASDFGTYLSGFQALGKDLSKHAQLQLFSCDTADNSAGKTLVNEIAAATNAEVFASTSVIGGSEHSWKLGYSTEAFDHMKGILNTHELSKSSIELSQPTDTWYQGTGSASNYAIFDNTSNGNFYYYYDGGTFSQPAGNYAYWVETPASAWSYYDGNTSHSVTGLGAAPVNVWFNGFETYAGWKVYDSSAGWEEYTHDNVAYWMHVDAANNWQYFNTTAWVKTDALGDAPYADGYHQVNVWFHDTVTNGAYNGYDVYLGEGITYVSSNYTAKACTFWYETAAGGWDYWDGSASNPTTGAGVAPVNVWFTGFGTYAGWRVYDSSAGWEGYTQDSVVYWVHGDAANNWQYFNTAAWVKTDALGDAPYADGYHQVNAWFHDTVTNGAYNGYDVYLGEGITYVSSNYTAKPCTFWSETAAGAWHYWDGSASNPTTGAGVAPVNVWFTGFGTYAGWRVYDSSAGWEEYTQDSVVYGCMVTRPTIGSISTQRHG